MERFALLPGDCAERHDFRRHACARRKTDHLWRRITALERALNAILFERAAGGYKLMPLGSALVAEAERAEAGAEAFGRRAVEAAQAERSLIRFTTSDWMAEQIAQAAVTQFARLRPDIRIALDVNGRRADLSGGEADVALRGGFSLDEPTLIARKVDRGR